jgi:hypothetical protein
LAAVVGKAHGRIGLLGAEGVARRIAAQPIENVKRADMALAERGRTLERPRTCLSRALSPMRTEGLSFECASNKNGGLYACLESIPRTSINMSSSPVSSRRTGIASVPDRHLKPPYCGGFSIVLSYG